MAQGIKESLELLEGIKTLGVTVRKVLADGKVNLADLPQAMALLTQFSVLAEAVNGVDQIPKEAKDLTMDEANQLIAKVLEVVNAIKAG